MSKPILRLALPENVKISTPILRVFKLNGTSDYLGILTGEDEGDQEFWLKKKDQAVQLGGAFTTAAFNGYRKNKVNDKVSFASKDFDWLNKAAEAFCNEVQAGLPAVSSTAGAVKLVTDQEYPATA